MACTTLMGSVTKSYGLGPGAVKVMRTGRANRDRKRNPHSREGSRDGETTHKELRKATVPIPDPCPLRLPVHHQGSSLSLML